MGLIKAAFGSVGGVLADQWKEFFYCESIPANVLVTKGQKRTGNRSSNTKGSDNIITGYGDLDGKPTSADALNILKYTVKIIAELPVK